MDSQIGIGGPLLGRKYHTLHMHITLTLAALVQMDGAILHVWVCMRVLVLERYEIN